MMQIKEITAPRYTESGAIDCEVLFEGMENPVPYTATPEDTAETGAKIWQELQSGRWGTIAPFTVTPEILESAKAAKRREIEAWRTGQESEAFGFEWNGHVWNAGPDTLARLSPVVMAAKSGAARDVMAWGDAENKAVTLSVRELGELAAAMAAAQTDRNNGIYIRQRKMKDELEKLDNLQAVRAFVVG